MRVCLLKASPDVPNAEAEYVTPGTEIKEEVQAPENVEVPTNVEATATPAEQAPAAQEVQPLAPTVEENTPVEGAVQEEVEENDMEIPTISEDQEEQVPEEKTEEVQNEIPEVPIAEEASEKIESAITAPVTEAVEEPVAENTEVELNLPEDQEDEVEDDFDFEDNLINSEVKVDSIDMSDDYMDIVAEANKDPDIAEGTKIISGLIKQNKELKDTVSNLEDELEQQKNTTRNIAGKAKMLEEKNEVLTEGRKKDRNTIVKLETEMKELENKVNYLERINSSQADELEMLRPQLEGKEELVKLYAEAEALLDTPSNYEEEYGYSKVA